MLTPVEDYLGRSTPEQQGIASAAILQFVEALDSQIHEPHSFMLLRHGNVVAEGWWSPYGRQYRHSLFSLSKSFTSTAVGLAVNEGLFSIDDPVLSFFPDETPAEVSDFLAAMRVRHLLSMSSGHSDDTWSNMFGRGDGNWIKGFFEVPVGHEPGTYFTYNSGASYMLSAIVQKSSGLKLVDYLETRLFAPLGIENATWTESPQGINQGGVGLSIRTEDIARFGQLYLQKGRWDGKQILPEAWVTEATAVQMSNGDGGDSDWTQGYGYQFWHCRHGAYRGDGVFGQFCIVMPEQDAVLAITGGVDVFDMQQLLDLVWDILLPGIGDEPAAEDGIVQQRLAEKLTVLKLPPVQGSAESAIAGLVSGRSYRFDANELEIETLTLHMKESGWTVSIQTAAGAETIPCGYGVWQQGQTSLFNKPWLTGSTPVVASGAWTADSSFTMVVRLYETPFFNTLVYHFDGDEVMIEIGVNVSLDSSKPLLLTAHAG